MKKFMAVILAGIMVLSGAVFNQEAYAKENWETEYEKLLQSTQTAKGRGIEYKYFALYDLDKDGIPELFLSQDNNSKQYQLYRYTDELRLENTFKADGFYIRTGEDEFVIYNQEDEVKYYLAYEKDTDIAQMDNYVLKAEYNWVRSLREDIWEFYYLDKEITEEQFENYEIELFREMNLVFRAIDDNSINRYLNEEKKFFAENSNPQIFINKKTIGNMPEYAKITFNDNNDVLWKENGQNYIDGLIMVNGSFVTDAYPVIYAGNTMVPLRAVGEMLNAEFAWDGVVQAVTIKKDNKVIQMVIGEKEAQINGKKEELSIEPMIIDGVTYVPLRFVGDTFNMDVDFWESDGMLPNIITLEDQYFSGINIIDADYILDIVERNFEDIQWTERMTAFSKSYMKEVLNIRLENDVIYNRFVSVILDNDGKVRLWTDQYTGQVFTVYNKGDEFTIREGEYFAVTSLVEEYL